MQHPKITQPEIHSSSRHALKKYLDKIGALHLNASPVLPSLDIKGYFWMFELIEESKAYLSRAIGKRTTFLSVPMYYWFKSLTPIYESTGDLDGEIYRTLQADGPLDLKDLCQFFREYPRQIIKKRLEYLQDMFAVTTLGKGRTLYQKEGAVWFTYLWGTSEMWESRVSRKFQVLSPEEAKTKIKRNLGNFLDKITLSKIVKEA